MNQNIVKLLFVSENNNNKYYNMTKSDGAVTFSVEYGRVGATCQKETYPLSKWHTKYNEKIKKGYKDITEISTVIQSNSPVKISEEQIIEQVILQLQKFANTNVSNTYLISASQVTKQQLEFAQKHVDQLSKIFTKYFGKSSWDITYFNNELLKLYTVIPRKMKKVQDHLIKPDSTKENLLSLITNEQDNLDSLSSQVISNTTQANNTEVVSSTLLETLGLEMTANVSDKEIKMIKELLNESVGKFSRAFRVTNKETQKVFDEHMKTVKDKTTKLYWHGSRNQNFWFILQQGLKIRPSGAVYSGSMYGDGIYFANKAQKSIGYTSLSGSYWAGGNANVAYLAIFEMHQGKAKDIHRHGSFCYSLNYAEIQKEGFDSVFAHKGADLRNDEIIIYNPAQCTIKYLVEIK